MIRLTLCSAKGAPGVTTLACVLGAVWPAHRSVVVAECDPSGGDLAGRFSLSTRVGMTSLVLAGRHGMAQSEDHTGHTQALPGGLDVLIAPTGADSATALDRELGFSSTALIAGDTDLLADCGRLLPGATGQEKMIGDADRVLLLVRPDVAGISHAQWAGTRLRGLAPSRFSVVIAGAGEFTAREVAGELDAPVIGSIPIDPAGALMAGGGPGTVKAFYAVPPGGIGPKDGVRAHRGALHRRPTERGCRERCGSSCSSAIGPVPDRSPAPIEARATPVGKARRSDLPMTPTDLEFQSTLAILRSDVADDLSTSGARELGLADRRELARQLAFGRLRDIAAERVALGRTPIDQQEEQGLVHAVLDALFGLGRLQALVDDPEIENIDVNGCDRVWVTYATGEKSQVDPIADSDAELVETLRSAAARFGLSERRFDTAHPELDLRLPDGSRLSALMSVVSRPAVSIRRHRFVDLSLADLEKLGTIDDYLHSLLAAVVRARKNIVVGGAMNSGKTTLIRALASEIPRRERIVTIEQAFELGLDSLSDRHPDLVALESRTANAEGEGGVAMARLVRRALRMNADRVIVGEVLGDEILPMLNAMSQGRSGSMCTIHSDSSSGVFRRLASYAVQAPERLPLESTNILIAGAVHFVVFVEATAEPRDLIPSNMDHLSWRPRPSTSETGSGRLRFEPQRHRRFVSSVREVVDVDGLHIVSNEIYRADGLTGMVSGAPLRSQTLDDLVAHGFEPSSFRPATAANWR